MRPVRIVFWSYRVGPDSFATASATSYRCAGLFGRGDDGLLRYFDWRTYGTWWRLT